MTQIQDQFLKPKTSIEDKGISMIVYGDPGVGKTSLIKTLLGWEHDKGFIHKPYCKPEEIFVIDVEAGERILVDENDQRLVTVFRVPENLDKFADITKFLKEGDHPFKFVFIDNMSELEKYFLIQITKLKDQIKVPRLKEWGETSYYMRKTVRDLRNLTWNGINIIFNFWAMTVPIEDKGGSITNYIAPMVMRSTTMEYVGLVEYTAYMGIDKKGDRFLQFESNQLVKCKRRSEKIDGFEKADLGELFRKLRGK